MGVYIFPQLWIYSLVLADFLLIQKANFYIPSTLCTLKIHNIGFYSWRLQKCFTLGDAFCLLSPYLNAALIKICVQNKNFSTTYIWSLDYRVRDIANPNKTPIIKTRRARCVLHLFPVWTLIKYGRHMRPPALPYRQPHRIYK